MSRQKDKGTSFETDTVKFLRARLKDDRIERRALHGDKDMGDVFNIFAHGNEGIAECKNYDKWSKYDLDKWKAETVTQRGNAGADFALLIVHEKGCGEKRFGQNSCYMQIRDMEKVAGGSFTCIAGDSARDMWVRVTVEDACQMIEGVYL